MESNENDVDMNEFNFMFERLIILIENHIYLPFNLFTAENLKKHDDQKLLNNENFETIKNIFNILRSHFLEQVNEEIKNFTDKYDLREKLKFKSEVFIYEILMKELGLKIEDLEELEEMNNLDNEDTSIMKYYLNKYTKSRNEELEKENIKLKEELRILKEKNNMQF